LSCSKFQQEWWTERLSLDRLGSANLLGDRILDRQPLDIDGIALVRLRHNTENFAEPSPRSDFRHPFGERTQWLA
jgi:hypothetical protein